MPHGKSFIRLFLCGTAERGIARICFFPVEVGSWSNSANILFLIMGFTVLFSGTAGAQGGPPGGFLGQFGNKKEESSPQGSGTGGPPSSDVSPGGEGTPTDIKQTPAQPGASPQPALQQPGMIQQQQAPYGQPMMQRQGIPQQAPGQFPQIPPQQPGISPQPAPQQPGMIQQQPAPYRQPLPAKARLPIIIPGDIHIEGVGIILKELLQSKEDKQWILKGYIEDPFQKIYLSNLNWSVKPDDGTFDIDSSSPNIAVIRLKNKKNIWADPKLKMVTKEYIFYARAQGQSGGKVTSVDSILFAQCFSPVEFYTADREPFDYPSGYEYRFSLKKLNGKFVDYTEYDELGKLKVNLGEEFKKRVIFHWNENTAGKLTDIKMEIFQKNRKVLKKIQKMTSTCRNIVGEEDLSNLIAEHISLAPTVDHIVFGWDNIQFEYMDEGENLFQLILKNFRITNNKNPNILNARSYFLEARFFHEGFQEGEEPLKSFLANQFSLVAKILYPHIENQRISLKGKMDDFSKMGYIAEDNPEKWFDGYIILNIIFDAIPMETVQKSSPYPCKYKYREGLFSKGYVFELREQKEPEIKEDSQNRQEAEKEE